ncbi:MAG: methylamine utilization protein MauG [Alphaproteobacteria bacterium]|nr:methylamine utilization protein MauG [Alphaproteobacteria bacterium]
MLRVRPSAACLAFALACIAAQGFAQSPLLGLHDPPVRIDDPPTPAKVALGRKLFFDRRLSVNGTMSCGMCHVPAQGFAANELRTPLGVEGRSVRRNAPTILNVAYYERLFHDGREATLEAQVWAPLLAGNEMGNRSGQAVVDRIAALPDYAGLFESAYDGLRPDAQTVGRALAAYERSLVSGGARFDRWWFGGERGALTAQEREGFAIFLFRGGCAQCHRVEERHALFTDQRYHNTGTGHARLDAARRPVRVELAPGVFTTLAPEAVDKVGAPDVSDAGRMEVTGDPADRWKYRTPSLRNVALTAPYMHDGSLATLEEVVEFYDRGGGEDPDKADWLFPLHLSAADKRALVAFLKTLTGANIEALVREAAR